MRRQLAWGMFALTALLALTHVALLLAASRPALSPGTIGTGFPLVDLGAVAGSLVGAVIVSRYPRHRIGWLFVVGQLLSQVGIVASTYGHSALSGELGAAPAGHVAIWLSIQLGGLFVVALLAVLFLLAPHGRLASPAWRWALTLPLAGLALSVGAVATVAPGDLDRNKDLIGGPDPTLEFLLGVAVLVVAAGVLVGVVSLVVRLRRASGDERQQLLWIVLAAGGLAAGVVLNLLAVILGAPRWVQPLPLQAAYVCIPVLTGIAILRYRLYEIDVFLDRAITLAVLTGFITAGYVGVVVLLGEVLPFTDGGLLPSLLATALVALAFQPVRKWVEHLADRVVYGSRAAPYVELAEFSRRLAEAPGMDDMLRRVGDAVAHAVGAREVRIRLDVPGRPTPEAAWSARPGSPRGRTEHVPVLDGVEKLGDLLVTMPPGAFLRPEEERLLADFAVQLGRAFRNIRLESTLVDRVARLEASTAALEASARRLDLARAAERRRFEASLARTVLPHLREVRGGLDELLHERELPRRAPDRLEALASRTQAALEELRALTRGVFPSQLLRSGLAPALGNYLARNRAGILEAEVQGGRRPAPQVESAAYFCAVEFLRELDTPAQVRLSEQGRRLLLEIDAPTRPPAPEATEHLHDRAAALEGTLAITGAADRTTLRLTLPLGPAADALPDGSHAVGVEVGLGEVGARPAP